MPGGERPNGGRPLLILFVTVFIDLVGFGIVIPLLPLYAEEFGAGAVAVTWLVAVFSLMQFFFAPWWGQLSDRVGRRPVLLIGLFGSAASYLLFGLAGSLATLFIARALAGIMGANIGVAQAYVADVTSAEDRARGMGLIGAAFGLGFIFGPAIGGALSTLGSAAPFYGAAALAGTNGILAIFWLPEPLPRPDHSGRSRHQPGFVMRMRLLWRSLSSRALGLSYAVFFAITFAFAGLEATFSLWGSRRWELSPAQIAYWFTYIGVLFTIVQGLLVGPLARRIGERRLVVIGCAAFVTGMIGIAAAQSLAVLAAALAALAFGQGTVVPSVSSLISKAAGVGEQGRLLGVSQSLSALGRIVGPVWAGVAFASIGIGAPFLTGALAVGLVAIAFVSLSSPLPRAAS